MADTQLRSLFSMFPAMIENMALEEQEINLVGDTDSYRHELAVNASQTTVAPSIGNPELFTIADLLTAFHAIDNENIIIYRVSLGLRPGEFQKSCMCFTHDKRVLFETKHHGRFAYNLTTGKVE